MASPTLPDRPPLTSESALHRWLDALLGHAVRTQLWLVFLDGGDRVVGPLMPTADLPLDPAHPVEADDLGTQPVATVLTRRFPMFAALVGAAQIVLVWERCGSSAPADADIAWADAVAAAWPGGGVRLRAQFALHDDGLTRIAPAGTR
ncbi:hypothetical protein AB3M83_07760 [Microbacterium sp. 179-B 1A2 NHS]|uniref:hypothetical protein n=1 Tax=Microbacterium sp. 179-B 1A2 NHS TaxID=3142383 RepID=UPI0039A2AE8F